MITTAPGSVSIQISCSRYSLLEVYICAMDLAFEVKMTRKNKTSFEEATF